MCIERGGGGGSYASEYAHGIHNMQPVTLRGDPTPHPWVVQKWPWRCKTHADAQEKPPHPPTHPPTLLQHTSQHNTHKPPPPSPQLTLGCARGAAGVADGGHIRGARRDVGARVAPPQALHLLQCHQAAVGASWDSGQAAGGQPPHHLGAGGAGREASREVGFIEDNGCGNVAVQGCRHGG